MDVESRRNVSAIHENATKWVSWIRRKTGKEVRQSTVVSDNVHGPVYAENRSNDAAASTSFCSLSLSRLLYVCVCASFLLRSRRLPISVGSSPINPAFNPTSIVSAVEKRNKSSNDCVRTYSLSLSLSQSLSNDRSNENPNLLIMDKIAIGRDVPILAKRPISVGSPLPCRPLNRKRTP